MRIKYKRIKVGWSRRLKNVLIFFISFLLVVVGILLIWTSTMDIPDLSSFDERRVSESTKIYDRTEKIVLYDVHRSVKRTVVPIDDISINARNATVAIEDAEFYSHSGIRMFAFLRAILVNISTGGFTQGGSTITQQVVKNTILTPEKTVARKLKEWVLALRLEQVASKDEILSLYLNEAPYGGNIYGIEQASVSFFGKTAKDLTLAESAYLAALPQAPTFYSPYGNNFERLVSRKNVVLHRMRELGFINDEEFNQAKLESVSFLPQESFGIKAPHFSLWVREYLENKYGERIIENGGLKVITTLDYDLQSKTEELILKYGEENETKYNANNMGAIGIDPKTGQVLVMVGSRDYFNTENDGNFNVTLGHRQPGSALKPFVYAAAFQKGYTPDTVVFDLQTQFQSTCDIFGRPLLNTTNPSDCYLPRNYDGKFRGPVLMKEALAQSLNIPAIKTLYLVGIKNALSTISSFGISSLNDPNRYGLTLVLGGGEVSLLELVNAYAVFGNGGVYNPYSSILKVEDRDGNVLEEFESTERVVIQKQISDSITSILSDDTLRAPIFGANSPLHIPGKTVGVKTGTTNDNRDAWIIGYTPNLSFGSWVGNNDNSPMDKRVAGYVVSPFWNEFFSYALGKLPSDNFNLQEDILDVSLNPMLRGYWQGGESYYIDSISGKLATELTPEETRKEIVINNVHSLLFWVDKNNPRGPKPKSPEQDPQYSLWEIPIQKWVSTLNLTQGDSGTMPTEYDDVHAPKNQPVVSFLSPKNGSEFSVNDRVTPTISISSVYPIKKADFFINGVFLGTSDSAPYNFVFTPSDFGISGGKNTLSVVVYDNVFNKKEVSVDVFINL